MAAPKYNVGDYVYLVVSAKRGFLEFYRIDQLRNYGSKYRYAMKIRPRNFKESLPTVGDRIDLRKTGLLEFKEEELCTYCEALVFKQAWLENELEDTINKISQQQCIVDPGSE